MKKIKILGIVLGLMMCLFMNGPVYAATGDTFTVPIENDAGTPYDVTFKVIDESAGTVQLGTGVGSEYNSTFKDGLTIPEKVSNGTKEYKVVAIAPNAFSNAYNKVGASNQEITSVKGEFIESVGASAFVDCPQLTMLDLEKATEIGDKAFYNCRSLETITLPEVISIGGAAFESCSSLETVSLPKAITIKDQSFFACSLLETVNLPKATSIGGYAFMNCASLETVNLPEVTTIESFAFMNCELLEIVNLPNATTIKEKAFFVCRLLETVNLPKATMIERNVFDTTSLSTLVLGITNDITYQFGSLGPSINPNNINIYLPDGHGLDELKFGSDVVAKEKFNTYGLELEKQTSTDIKKRVGEKVELSVKAEITGGFNDSLKGIHYQWEKKVNNGWEPVVGETSSTLSITSLTESDLGEYQCQIKPVNFTELETISETMTLKINTLIANFADSMITSIEEGKNYVKGTSIEFSVKGAGMDNNSPNEGDTRYLPLRWKTNSSRTFTNTYTARIETKDMALGKYELEVTFMKQEYISGAWTDSAIEESKKVEYSVVETSSVKPSDPKGISPETKDTSNVLLYFGFNILSLGIIIYIYKRNYSFIK